VARAVRASVVMEQMGLLVFIHVVAALGMFAAFSVEGVAQAYLRMAETGEEVRRWSGAYRVVPPVAGVSVLTLLATGVWMTLAEWGWTGWILVAGGAIILLAAVGASGGIRYSAAVQAAAGESGPLSASRQGALRERLPLASLVLRVFIGLGIVFLMTVKPEIGGSLLTLVVAALLGVGAAYLIAGRMASGSQPPLPQ
jgi:hypothetical protein